MTSGSRLFNLRYEVLIDQADLSTDEDPIGLVGVTAEVEAKTFLRTIGFGPPSAEDGGP